MILGAGLDVFDVARMTREVSNPGSDLAVELFTAAERAAALAPGRRARVCAALYSAKEAVFKALGTGKVGAMTWHDIDLSAWRDGACDVQLSGETARAAAAMGVGRVLLSVTTTRAQAVAWAVAVAAPAPQAAPRGPASQPDVENA